MPHWETQRSACVKKQNKKKKNPPSWALQKERGPASDLCKTGLLHNRLASPLPCCQVSPPQLSSSYLGLDAQHGKGTEGHLTSTEHLLCGSTFALDFDSE